MAKAKAKATKKSEVKKTAVKPEVKKVARVRTSLRTTPPAPAQPVATSPVTQKTEKAEKKVKKVKPQVPPPVVSAVPVTRRNWPFAAVPQ